MSKATRTVFILCLSFAIAGCVTGKASQTVTLAGQIDQAIAGLQVEEETKRNCRYSTEHWISNHLAELRVTKPQENSVLVINAGGAYISLTTLRFKSSGDGSTVDLLEGEAQTQNRVDTETSRGIEANFQKAYGEFKGQKSPHPDPSSTHESCIVVVGVEDQRQYVHAYSGAQIQKHYPDADEAISNAYKAVKKWPGEE